MPEMNSPASRVPTGSTMTIRIPPLTKPKTTAFTPSGAIPTACHSWEGAAFPAVLANCEACHTGNAKNVANWKTVPSRAACGSCHDNVNFATGANHSGKS